MVVLRVALTSVFCSNIQLVITIMINRLNNIRSNVLIVIVGLLVALQLDPNRIM